MRPSSAGGSCRAIVLAIAMGLAGCASVMGEPVDVSDYCYEETPRDWDYCSWYYEESTRCWMCNPIEE